MSAILDTSTFRQMMVRTLKECSDTGGCGTRLWLALLDVKVAKHYDEETRPSEIRLAHALFVTKMSEQTVVRQIE